MPVTRFKVVKEAYGWAVRLDDGMMSPFWSKELAVEHANCCAGMLRQYGEQAHVIVEEIPAGQSSRMRAL